VLVGKEGAIAAAKAIDLTDEPESIAGQFETERLAVFVGRQAGMQLPAREDAFTPR
jgi:hypothetical protein